MSSLHTPVLLAPLRKSRSTEVAAAEQILVKRLELTHSTSKLAGFRRPDGTELALLREGDSLRLFTKPMPGPDGFDLQREYAPMMPRHHHLKQCAPTLAIGNRACSWRVFTAKHIEDWVAR